MTFLDSLVFLLLGEDLEASVEGILILGSASSKTNGLKRAAHSRWTRSLVFSCRLAASFNLDCFLVAVFTVTELLSTLVMLVTHSESVQIVSNCGRFC